MYELIVGISFAGFLIFAISGNLAAELGFRYLYREKHEEWKRLGSPYCTPVWAIRASSLRRGRYMLVWPFRIPYSLRDDDYFVNCINVMRVAELMAFVFFAIFLVALFSSGY